MAEAFAGIVVVCCTVVVDSTVVVVTFAVTSFAVAFAPPFPIMFAVAAAEVELL